MSIKKSTAFLSILLILSLPSLVFSAQAGKIEGKVTDASTKQPLYGANVILVGTSLGAATDIDGNYVVQNIPPGTYILRVSYIGYKNKEVNIEIKGGFTLSQNFKLNPVAVKGKTVTVTAQASGQNAAINQQLSSDNIVNVVSAARIQELPDENAAESVGRLPGVSLIRNGGEGSSVVIRGLEPKYNEIMIDGVPMAGTSGSDRGTDLSMISSNALEGIEVSKTVTPDMDAAVLGGVVNFKIREAKSTLNGAPEIGLLAQGGYKNIRNGYNDYKLVGSIGNRFMNNRFGVFAQAIIEKVDLSDDELSGSYDVKTKNFGVPNPVILNSMSLSFNPRDRRRYDGTLVLDYHWTNGKIDFVNFLSKSNTKTQNRSQTYSLSGNSITYGIGYTPNTMNVIQNIISMNQDFSSFKLDVKLSHSYTENISPGTWNVNFTQNAATTSEIPDNLNPVEIAKEGVVKTNLSNLFFGGISDNNSFARGRIITGSIDLEKNITLSDLISATIKTGGQYMYTTRWYNYETGTGNLYYPGDADGRKAVLNANPWMSQAPYNINPNGSQQLPIAVFEDPRFSYGKFINGDYSMGPAINLGLVENAYNIVKQLGDTQPFAVSGIYSPDALANIANNYYGNEYRHAFYAMATVNIGSELTLIPGVRYQGLETSYKGPQIPAAFMNNPYPAEFPHTDTTVNIYHGYWLPDFNLRYKPLSWFDLRLAYTNTLSYPDFNAIIPRLEIFLTSVTWNNYLLEPGRSKNYDLQASIYDNTIGLFTAGAFMKRIDKLIYNPGTIYITDPSKYPGLPSFTKGYTINSNVNNPNRINLWGVEMEWQTHFWYLPNPFKGLVMNINYTHIFSKANYSYTYTKVFGYPTKVINIDTTYTDRLIDQPDDIVNFTLGYDYKGFSARLSMQYKSNVFNGTNFWPELRRYQNTYLRWDFSAKQNLPWYGLEVFLDLINLNSENDINLIRGPGFPASEQDYGLVADLGVRWKL